MWQAKHSLKSLQCLTELRIAQRISGISDWNFQRKAAVLYLLIFRSLSDMILITRLRNEAQNLQIRES